MTASHSASGWMPPGTVPCGLLAHAAVRLTAVEAHAMRQAPIKGCGDAFSVSTLRHFDEQTLAVIAALRLALGPTPAPQTDWGVLAAPRYLGRSLMGPCVARFHEEGAWGVSPHLVPHRSLHSISGSISQYLKAHGPNFGIGGGPGSEVETLFAATALLSSTPSLPGVWVVLCRVEPEVAPGEGGRPQPEVSCEAVVMALVPETVAAPLRLDVTAGEPGDAPPLDFAALAALPETIGGQGTTAWSLGRFGRCVARQAVSPSATRPYPTRSRAAG